MPLLIQLFTFLVLANSTNAISVYQNLFETPQLLHLKATVNTGKCNNKAYIPVQLPANTSGVIYAVTAVNKADAADLQPWLHHELSKVSADLSPEDAAAALKPKENNQTFNSYLIEGKAHIEGFSACDYYMYLKKDINTASHIRYVPIKDPDVRMLYVGIENNKDLRNLRVAVEVVAVLKS